MLKGEPMKNVITLLAITMSLLIGACSQSREKAEGGVDGSGGDMPYFVEESVRDWLQTSHKYYMRDMIHRLFLIKENSPSDFGSDREAANKFLGNDQAAFLKEMDQIKYTLVSGRCPSTNPEHGQSDASYSPGNICFSYSAFKNLPLGALISRMISLTFHELAHMRGFSEPEAIRWQLAFKEDAPLAGKTITWQNYRYKENSEIIESIDFNLGMAFSAIAEKWDHSKITACQAIAAAEAMSSRFSMSAQWAPRYISDHLHSQLATPLYSANDCAAKSEYEIIESLIPIMKALIEANRMFAQYDSPFCKDLMCLETYPRYSAQSLLWFEATSSLLKKNETPAAVRFDRTECTLIHVGDNQEIPLEYEATDGGGKFVSEIKDPRFPDLKAISYISIGKGYDGSTSQIKISHDGMITVLDSKGFVPSALELKGNFFSEQEKSIYTRFSTIKDELAGTDALSFKYGVYSSFTGVIPEAPSVINTYELRCSLGY